MNNFNAVFDRVRSFSEERYEVFKECLELILQNKKKENLRAINAMKENGAEIEWNKIPFLEVEFFDIQACLRSKCLAHFGKEVECLCSCMCHFCEDRKRVINPLSYDRTLPEPDMVIPKGYFGSQEEYENHWNVFAKIDPQIELQTIFNDDLPKY